MSNFKKFQNSCVDSAKQDLAESYHAAGDQNLEGCLQACEASDACTGVEWYNKGGDGKRCFFINSTNNKTPAAAGSPAKQWKDAVCFVKKTADDKACSTYTRFQNFCVNKAGKDIPQTRWQAGQASLEACQAECNKNIQCSAVEWYESGWNRSKCHLLITGTGSNKAAGGSQGRQW